MRVPMTPRPAGTLNWLTTAGEALLAALATTYIGALAVLAAGFSITPASAGLVAAAAVVAAGLLCRLRLPAGRATLAFGAALAVALASIILAGQVEDVSWDGQFYHQAAIIALGNGWNPLVEPYSDAMVSGTAARFADAQF
jgi:hypothetical protein